MQDGLTYNVFRCFFFIYRYITIYIYNLHITILDYVQDSQKDYRITTAPVIG